MAIVRRRRRGGGGGGERRQKVSSSEVRMERMNNNSRQEGDYRFTPNQVLIYCLIVGVTSAILSILIDGISLLSMVAFLFASITNGICLKRNFINGKRERKSKSMFNG